MEDCCAISVAAHVLRVAALRDLRGTHRHAADGEFSDYLTWIAGSYPCRQCCWLPWRVGYDPQRHGFPKRADASLCEMDFVILGLMGEGRGH